MPRTADQAYADLIRRIKEATLLGSCTASWAGTNGPTCRGRAPPTAANRWHCSPASATRCSPPRSSANCSPRSRARRWSASRTRRRPSTSARSAAATTGPSSCPGRWSRSWPASTTRAQQVWQRGTQGRTTSPRSARGSRRSSRSSARRPTPSATAACPTTPCSTSTSRARRRPRSRASSPTCASELVPLVAAIAASGKRPRARASSSASTRSIGSSSSARRPRRRSASTSTPAGSTTTAHPFCSGIGPGDCRLTTRYNPRHFNEAFFGILHEAGHGIYEQGLAGRTLRHAARARPCSLGIHESQSRLWENQVGRGRPFWEHFFPRARQTFPRTLRDVSLDDWLFAINDVRPSFIRVEADEATYNLHIILRFELEQALIRGDLQPCRRARRRGTRSSQQVARPDAAGRRPGLLAGHPLERRRHRLLPDLHAGQPVRGPVHGAGAARPAATSTPTSAAASSAG